MQKNLINVSFLKTTTNTIDKQLVSVKETELTAFESNYLTFLLKRTNLVTKLITSFAAVCLSV